MATPNFSGMLFQNALTENREMDINSYRQMLALEKNDPFYTPGFGGMLGGAGGGFYGGGMGMGMSPQMMQQQLQYGNLTNPNQKQGLANNAGMALGGLLNNVGAGLAVKAPNQPQTNPPPLKSAGDPLYSRMMELTDPDQGQGLSYRAAAEQAAREYYQSNKNDPQAAMRTEMLLSRAKDLPEDFKPGPISTSAAIARGWKGTPKPNIVLVQDKSGDIKEQPLHEMTHSEVTVGPNGEVESVWADKAGNVYHNDGTPIRGNIGGVRARLTGEVSGADKEFYKQADNIQGAMSINQNIDLVEKSMDKNKIAPGGILAYVADKASDLKGVVDFVQGNVRPQDDPKALDASATAKIYNLADKGVKNQEAQTAILALAYQLARQAGVQRIGIGEIKQQLDMLGDGRVQPEAVKGALEAVRSITNNSVQNWHNTHVPILEKQAMKPTTDAYYKVYNQFHENYLAPKPETKETTEVDPVEAELARRLKAKGEPISGP